jgi:hypothetical protein
MLRKALVCTPTRTLVYWSYGNELVDMIPIYHKPKSETSAKALFVHLFRFRFGPDFNGGPKMEIS